MGVFDWLFGSDDQINQMPAKNEGQLNALQSLLQNMGQMNPNIVQDPLYQQGRSQLSDLLNPSQESFDKFASPFMRQFQQQIAPNIVNRYADSSSKGSSSFQNAMGQAGVNLTSNLASIRSNLQQDALTKALGYAQQPVTNYSSLFGQAMGTDPFAYGKISGQPGFLNNLVMALAKNVKIPGMS